MAHPASDRRDLRGTTQSRWLDLCEMFFAAGLLRPSCAAMQPRKGTDWAAVELANLRVSTALGLAFAQCDAFLEALVSDLSRSGRRPSAVTAPTRTVPTVDQFDRRLRAWHRGDPDLLLQQNATRGPLLQTFQRERCALLVGDSGWGQASSCGTTPNVGGPSEVSIGEFLTALARLRAELRRSRSRSIATQPARSHARSPAGRDADASAARWMTLHCLTSKILWLTLHRVAGRWARDAYDGATTFERLVVPLVTVVCVPLGSLIPWMATRKPSLGFYTAWERPDLSVRAIGHARREWVLIANTILHADWQSAFPLYDRDRLIRVRRAMEWIEFA